MPPKNKRHQPPSPTASSAPSKRRRADSNSNQALAKTSAAPPDALGLAPEYPDSNTIHIVASSKIQAKVRAVLTALSSDPSPDANIVVVLQARAPAANKLITVAEIAKRELEQQQKLWWSYVGIKGMLEELKPKNNQRPNVQQDRNDEAEAGETRDEEEDAFEPPPGQQNKPKVRNVAIMTFYLANKPIPALRALYGEQHSET